jgi:hypothetical protein
MTIPELLANVVTVAEAKRRKAVAVCGPYKAVHEDWMLMRALQDCARSGRLDTVLLVREQNCKMSSHRTEMGVSIWRLSTKE